MRRQDKMPARNKKNFRPTKAGAGMTRAGVKEDIAHLSRIMEQKESHAKEVKEAVVRMVV